jgi:hypothetical protein
MKRNRILLLALLVLLIVGAFFLYISRPVQNELDVATTPTHQGTLPPPVAPQLARPGGEVKNEPDTTQQKAYMAAFLTPIAFWGKVVDETGAPVAGATVKLGANDNPNPMGKGSTYELATNTEGLFSIKDIRGISLSVQVSKAGYYSTNESRGKANYVLKNNTDLPVPTPNSPAVFVLRKMGEAAALLRVENSINLPKNGSPVMIDLESGKVSSQGDVKIACWVQDQGVDTTVYNPYDWRCVISAPGGGLVERGEPLDFTAPKENYQQYDVIQMPRTTENWRQQASKEYFIKRADGTFGRLQVRVVTGANNFVRFESFVNPKTGDRNLQYDSAKNIQ